MNVIRHCRIAALKEGQQKRQKTYISYARNYSKKLDLKSIEYICEIASTCVDE